MYRLMIKLLFFFLLINNNYLYAKVENPINVLKNINENILKVVNNNLNLSDVKLNSILEECIIPCIDFNEMCMWIVGKSIWKNISVNKQNDFITEFQKLVVRTYSATLIKYIKSNVIFFENKHFNNENIKIDRKIQISSEIEHVNGGKNLHVDYRLILHKETWLLYDLIIEGVSILKGFQAQFSSDIKNNGIDFVINKIRHHNNG